MAAELRVCVGCGGTFLWLILQSVLMPQLLACIIIVFKIITVFDQCMEQREGPLLSDKLILNTTQFSALKVSPYFKYLYCNVWFCVLQNCHELEKMDLEECVQVRLWTFPQKYGIIGTCITCTQEHSLPSPGGTQCQAARWLSTAGSPGTPSRGLMASVFRGNACHQ